MAGARKFIDAKLKQRNVLLFSKKGSPECKTVKEMLSEYKMAPSTYEIIEIDQRQDCTEIENYFMIICMTSRRSVPRLFVKGKYIGSDQEIRRMHENGELKKLLTESGAFS